MIEGHTQNNKCGVEFTIHDPLNPAFKTTGRYGYRRYRSNVQDIGIVGPSQIATTTKQQRPIYYIQSIKPHSNSEKIVSNDSNSSSSCLVVETLFILIIIVTGSRILPVGHRRPLSSFFTNTLAPHTTLLLLLLLLGIIIVGTPSEEKVYTFLILQSYHYQCR